MKNLLFIFCVLLATRLSSQVKIFADTTTIRIGEPIEIFVEVENKGDIIFPNLVDSIGKFEILDQRPIEISKNLLKKWIQVSVYDSGQYVFSKLPILIDSDTVYTEPILINVFNMKIDMSKPMFFDIKDIMNLPASMWNKYFWIIISFIRFVIVALIIILIYRLSKKKKVDELKTLLPAHLQAIEMLKKLDEKPFLNLEEFKKYYSELIEIIKYYINRKFSITTHEFTSNQVLNEVNSLKEWKNEPIIMLREIFQDSDLVKFAKLKPIIGTVENHRKIAEQIILLTYNRAEENQKKEEN